jgi:hypothetical protein
MPTFSGKFEQRASNGAAQQSGSCRLTFDDESLRLVSERAPECALDLGDIDVVDAADHQLTLKVYDGTTIVLNQFGNVFQNMRHELMESWRKRLIQCLLLEDLQEITRLDGFAQLDSTERTFSSPAEIRLYKSNLAILPAAATAFQWRLADIDAVDFDEATYALSLQSGKDRLTLTRLAKRTREFAGQLRDALESVSDKGARVLQAWFPFLLPDQFTKVSAIMKEGRAVPVAQLAEIHPLTEKALIQNAVSASLGPYFNALSQRVVAPGCYAGFKLIRKEVEGEEPEEEASPDVPAEGAEKKAAATEPEAPLLDLGDESLLCWFFFPLKGASAGSGGANLVAWECTSQRGRATYVFRLAAPGQAQQIDEAIQRLNRGIVIVNFRREPIYLPNSSLEIQPRYHRYAIAQRNIAVLRELRQSLVGRALHVSLEAWQNQLEALINQ